FELSAGMALAARTALPIPTTGPYQAILASTAKSAANRHRPHTRAMRYVSGKAAEQSRIAAVYHGVICVPMASGCKTRFATSRERIALEKYPLCNCQFHVYLRRRQQRVMDEAVMHNAHQAFGLFLVELNGTDYTHAKIAEPRGLLQLFGVHRDFDAAVRYLASGEVLHRVEGGTRSQ